MVFKNLLVLVLWMKVAFALEALEVSFWLISYVLKELHYGLYAMLFGCVV